MGFKADTSFLRFLTMGAIGARHVMDELRRAGFTPIELERYSTSNKLWSTKIKRLRLPDLMCVHTGLRVEVRAKGNLEIRMSHTPKNKERHWDAGLRPQDVIALISCKEVNGRTSSAGSASYFGVKALRASVDARQLSAVKAASEGAEQYLTWPSIVSRRPGRVLECDGDRLTVEWGAEGGMPARRHTYALKGKHSYVTKGQTFCAKTQILAGTPKGFADLSKISGRRYFPLEELRSPNTVDRYCAAKAIAFREDISAAARPVLESMVGKDEDDRLALEVASAAASQGVQAGIDHIHGVLWNTPDAPLRMEAAFVLTELGVRTGPVTFADMLAEVAGERTRFNGDEVRQAAVWGLGREGLRQYARIMEFLADDDENVALHAIAAFGPDAPESIVHQLVAGLGHESARVASASSEALRVIGSPTVLRSLIEAARGQQRGRPWVLATLGRLPEASVRLALAGDPLLDEITPLLLACSGWVSTEEVAASLRFLLKQAL